MRQRIPRAAPVGLLVLTLLSAFAAPASASLELLDGPRHLREESWRFVVLQARNPAAQEAALRLRLRRRSGAESELRWELPALGTVRHEVYDYAGHPDPLVAAEADLGQERARWTSPEGIPPERAVLLLGSDQRWAPWLGAALGEAGLGVQWRPPGALPERWMGLRGLAAVAVERGSLPAPAARQREALVNYVEHGGLLLLLGGGDPSGELVAGPRARGRIVTVPEGAAAAPLAPAPWPRPPAGAAALSLANGDAWPPLASLLTRWGLYALAALAALALVRRRPSLGLGCLLAVSVAAALPAPLAGARLAPSEQRASSDGTPPRALDWIELRFIPERHGPTPLRLPQGPEAAVVGLRRGEPVPLRFLPEEGFVLEGRWGEPRDLLLETSRPGAPPAVEN